MNRSNQICLRIMCVLWSIIAVAALIGLDAKRLIAPLAVTIFPSSVDDAHAVEDWAIVQNRLEPDSLHDREYSFGEINATIYARAPLHEYSPLRVQYCDWLPWFAVRDLPNGGIISFYSDSIDGFAIITYLFYIVTGGIALFYLLPRRKQKHRKS